MKTHKRLFDFKHFLCTFPLIRPHKHNNGLTLGRYHSAPHTQCHVGMSCRTHIARAPGPSSRPRTAGDKHAPVSLKTNTSKMEDYASVCFSKLLKKTNKTKHAKSLIYSSPFIIFEFGKMQFIKLVCCNTFRTINENESCFWLVYLTKIKTAANCQRSDQSAAHRTNSNTLSDTVERPTTYLGFLIFADNAMGSLGGVDNILPRQWAGVT